MIRYPGLIRTVPATLAFLFTIPGATAFAQDFTPSPQPASPPIAAVGTFDPAALVKRSDGGQESRLFADLFKPLPRDFQGMLSRNNLFLAGIGVLGAAAGTHWDTSTSAHIWGQEMAVVMQPGEVAGGFLVQTGAAVATYSIGRATNSTKVTSIGASLFRAQVVSQTVTQGIKFAARRTRPDGTVLSFPSGHSATAFATATVLQSELGWKVGVAAYGAAAWIAGSRIQAKRHYLSDVIAGATIGIMAGRSVTVGSGSMKFAVSPTPVPRGVAVNVVKLGTR